MSPLGFSWARKGRRSSRKPRTYASKPTWGAKKPRSVVKKVAALSRQVSKLNSVAMNRLMYSCYRQFNCATALGLSSYDATPLLKFDNWSRVFGTDADDETQKKALLRKLNLNWQILTNEPDARYYSVFVVSLKDEASPLLNTDGTLATLTQGTHYSDPQGQGSGVLLNLKFFNIHYHRRFQLGVVPQVKAAVAPAGAVQNIGMTSKDSTRTGKVNLTLGKNGMRIINPSGDWKAGVYPKDPSKNYFFLTFWSGDSTADVEVPTMYYQWLTSVDAST